MTNKTISEVLGDIQQYKFNPALIQKQALNVLRQVTDGAINIVDPTNPFVYCLENTACNTAVFMQQNEASTRRLYPAAALDAEDLYLHMSDKDYVDRFAKPASADFILVLPKDVLINLMVEDPTTGNKKLVIPRNTVFTIANVPFSLQYPVELRLLSHGGLQIVYINDKPSPLQTLSTNLIDWIQFTDNSGITWVKFSLTASQFTVETAYNEVSSSAGFKTEVTISDQFYYVRCYLQNNLGKWVEMLTTHTTQIYDPATPTAVIRVLNKKIRVIIPVIYTTSGLVRGKLRIDVYQTKGGLNMLLRNYKAEEYQARWYNIDKADDDIFNVAIRQVTNLFLMSESHVSGGRDALSFKELKSRVIKNAIGAQALPITNVQLQASVEDLGYAITKDIDTVTNRVYLASRGLPKPSDDKILTSAASTMATITLSLKDAANASGSFDNGTSVTLTSSTLYRNINGVTKPVSRTDWNSLNSFPILDKCRAVSEGDYFYSPFAYVLDTATKTFEVRPYYLDQPKVETKNFVSENESTGLQASVSTEYSIDKTPTGYALYVKTQSSSAFRELPDSQVFAQIALQSPNQPGKVYLLGEQMGKEKFDSERVFKFVLDSNFYVDADDYLQLISLSSDSNGLPVKTALVHQFDIFFITTAQVAHTYTPSNIDLQTGQFQMPANTVPVGISHETLTLRFGYSLKTLWAQSRSVVSSVPYKIHNADVPAIYSKDVYDIDPDTGSHFKIDEFGHLTYLIKHRAGEPVLDHQNRPVMVAYKGEVVYDGQGLPLVEEGFERHMIRIVDVLMIEGVYYFATDSVINSYKAMLHSSLVQWITLDMLKYQDSLLDQTRIYFYPKVNAGNIRILGGKNETVTIPSGQSLKVKLSVSPKTYNDLALREQLSRVTIRTIDTMFQNAVVAVSAIEYALMNEYKGDVIDVDLSGIGGNANHATISVIDNSSRLSIRKRLTAMADNSLVAEEDVLIQFIKHGFDV
jgi:hypothetical protein